MNDEVNNAQSSRTVSTTVAYVLMSLTVFIFASAFAGIRYMLDTLDPMTFTGLRLSIAAIGFVVGGLIARVQLLRREDIVRTVIAGLFGFSLYHVTLNFGAMRISAGQAAFVTSTIPLWTAFAAWRVLGEEVSPRHWVGLLVSLMGIGVMSLQPGDMDLGVGSLFVLLAAIFAAANIVLQKDLVSRYAPFGLTAQVALVGSLPMILWMLTKTERLTELTPTHWAVVTYLGLGPIVLGYWLSTIALKALPAYRTSQFLLLISPIAALVAWVALDEVPTAKMLTGGAVVLLGVAITIRRRNHRAEDT